MTESNEKSLPDEEKTQYALQSEIMSLWLIAFIHLSPSQKKQLITMVENGVKELKPDDVLLDICIEEEKRRLINAVEFCWRWQIWEVDRYKDYYSEYVVRDEVKLALEYVNKLLDIIDGDNPTSSIIHGIVGDYDLTYSNKLIAAIHDIEISLYSYLEEEKPQKRRISNVKRDSYTIPGLVTTFCWYLGNPYLKERIGKSKYDFDAVDIICDLVTTALTYMGVPLTDAGNTSKKGEKAQGRLRKLVKKILKERVESNRHHLVETLLDNPDFSIFHYWATR